MTKEVANEIKRILKESGTTYHSFYFKNKTGELRIETCECHEDEESQKWGKEAHSKRLLETLNTLTQNGMRPPYRTERKRLYFGYAHYIIFR